GVRVVVLARAELGVGGPEGAGLVADAGGGGKRRAAFAAAAPDGEVVAAGLTRPVARHEDAVGAVLAERGADERAREVALVVVVLDLLAVGVDEDEVGIERGGAEVEHERLAGAPLHAVFVEELARAERLVAVLEAAPLDARAGRRGGLGRTAVAAHRVVADVDEEAIAAGFAALE